MLHITWREIWKFWMLTCLTLYPALALVSMNITFNSFAFRSPSSVDTCLLSDKSVLFPTNIIITSLPLSVRTSSIHFEVWWNELASAKWLFSHLLLRIINININISFFDVTSKWIQIHKILYRTCDVVNYDCYRGISYIRRD